MMKNYTSYTYKRCKYSIKLLKFFICRSSTKASQPHFPNLWFMRLISVISLGRIIFTSPWFTTAGDSSIIFFWQALQGPLFSSPITPQNQLRTSFVIWFFFLTCFAPSSKKFPSGVLIMPRWVTSMWVEREYGLQTPTTAQLLEYAWGKGHLRRSWTFPKIWDIFRKASIGRKLRDSWKSWTKGNRRGRKGFLDLGQRLLRL